MLTLYFSDPHIRAAIKKILAALGVGSRVKIKLRRFTLHRERSAVIVIGALNKKPGCQFGNPATPNALFCEAKRLGPVVLPARLTDDEQSRPTLIRLAP